MPSMPRTPFGRRGARRGLEAPRAPEREDPRVEIVEDGEHGAWKIDIR